jgi:hypothetical protein
MLGDQYMGAVINSKEKVYFLADIHGRQNGASVDGTPAFVLNNSQIQGNYVKLAVENVKSTWLVCPHLSDQDKVFNYYLSSGLIILVMGKCFCETCLDMILMKDDLTEVLRLSQPMTDQSFQNNFINPLKAGNYNFTKMAGYISDNEDTPKTWVTCSHLSTPDGLEAVYSRGGQLFIFESYVTCHECFDKIPTDSLIDVLYEGESMTDERFQKKIIDALYAINYDSLEAIGHFDFKQVWPDSI